MKCWKNSDRIDRDCLGYLAVEDIGFDYKKSRKCEWTRLIERLYDKRGVVIIGTKDLKHETAIDLARKWDKLVVSVKYSLMGWK
jgi:hypothetical protein